MGARFKKWIKAVLLFLSLPKAMIFFKRKGREVHPDLEDDVDLVFRWKQRAPFLRGGLVIRPIQIEEELLRFLRVLEKKEPRTICEIGTARGGFLYLLTRVASPNALIISIDLPRGRFGGGYPLWKTPLYRSFARRDQEIHLIRGDSHIPSTKERAESKLEGRYLDLLVIDGDHSYEGVKKDFESYLPLLDKHGIVAFHDIVEGPSDAVGGVPEFWKEIKGRYPNEEIVASYEQGGYGIGLLYFG